MPAHLQCCAVNRLPNFYTLRLLCPLLIVLIAALLFRSQSHAGHINTCSQQTCNALEMKDALLNETLALLQNDPRIDHKINQHLIQPLIHSPTAQLEGPDPESRAIAVNFQSAFESTLLEALRNNRVQKAIIIMHTHMPTTPLCSPRENVLTESINASMENKPVLNKTIKDRTKTLREFAQLPNVDLYIAYAKDGLIQRTPPERANYLEAINDPKNTALHDVRLSCSEIPDDVVGASYVLTTNQGDSLYFGLSGKQAVDGGEGATSWAFWFGSLGTPAIQSRYQKIMSYLQGCGLELNDVGLTLKK